MGMSEIIGLSVAKVEKTTAFKRLGCQGPISNITLVSERIANN